MQITSSAFDNNSKIPTEYTCEGPNVNPPLTFHDIPKDARSLVLTVEDKDSGKKPWIHWFVYNIPPTTTDVLKNTIPQGGMEGYANGGTEGYEGPCPIYFHGTHTYRFILYALDTLLTIPQSSTRYDIEDILDKHTIKSAVLIGTAIGNGKALNTNDIPT